MICTFTGNECTEKPYCEKRGQCFRAVAGLVKPANAACLQVEARAAEQWMVCKSTGERCDRQYVCMADGECNYTGSPLSDPRSAPGHTDLMVTPEAIDECIAANPLPIDPMTQPANPKQIHGDKKLPLYLVPFSFAANVCVALYEGMTKYGLVNWRVAKVEAMTYASACKRHLDKWIGGQDHDPVTKVRHLANAGACIAILIDAELCGTLIDNRPLPIKQSAVDKMVAELEETIAHLKVLHKDYDPKHYLITDITA